MHPSSFIIHRSSFSLPFLEPLEPRRLLSTSTWTGAGHTSNWSNPANWDIPPVAGADLIFPDVTAGSNDVTPTNDLPAGTPFNSITVVGSNYQLSGNPIQLGAGGITNDSFAGLNIGMDIILAADQTWTNAQNPGVMLISGNITAGSHNLNIHENRIGIGFAGNLTSTATINVGAGIATFTGIATGTIQAQSGAAITVNGNASGAAFNLASGASLVGVGSAGNVTAAPGSSFQPGGFDLKSDTLGTGDLTLASGATFFEELPQSASGKVSADTANVTGTVNLGGATFDANYNFSATTTLGDVLTVVNNDGTDAVTGTFNNLPEGSIVSIRSDNFTTSLPFRISYVGGDGNDVTLTRVSIGAIQFAAPVFSVGNGQSAAVVTVARTGGAAGPASAVVTTSGGTAVAGTDYTPINTTVNFADGQTSQTVSIPLIGTAISTGGKTVGLGVFNEVNADVGPQRTAILGNNVPLLSITSDSVVEGNSGQTAMPFTVTLSQPSAEAVTAFYTTVQGTAVSPFDFEHPKDFESASGGLIFAPGQTSITVFVQVDGDTTFETDETFGVQLSDASDAGLDQIHGGDTGTGTIINDDTAPILTVNSVNVPSSGGAASFTVSFSGATEAFPITVNYATADGTAKAGTDYTATSGTLSIEPNGGLSGVVSVPVTNTGASDDHNFFLVLSNPTNATLVTPQGTATIVGTHTPVTTITDPINPTKTAVLISGTSGNDTISLSPGKKKNTTTVLLNGVSQGDFAQPTGDFIINGGDGNDTLDARKIKVKTPVILNGGNGDDIIFGSPNADIIRTGSGNDYVNAGNGNNIVIGSDGVDILQAGSGKDLLIGGTGSDFLFGGSGNDLLIAGSTAYDADTPANNLALIELESTWVAKKTYAQALAAVISPVGTSGASFSSTTITDDNAVDTLKGNAGTDAFFGHFTGTGALDLLTDKAKSETAIEI